MRVVNEEDGRRIASLFGATFVECCVARDGDGGKGVNEVIQGILKRIVGKKRSVSPTRLCASDSEISTSQSSQSSHIRIMIIFSFRKVYLLSISSISI